MRWRAILTNRQAVLGAAGVLLAVHLVWAHASRNGVDLARCGALWAVLAGLLIARPVLRLGYTRWFIISRGVNDGSFDPDPAQEEEARQVAIDAKHVQIYGPALLVAGTVL